VLPRILVTCPGSQGTSCPCSFFMIRVEIPGSSFMLCLGPGPPSLLHLTRANAEKPYAGDTLSILSLILIINLVVTFLLNFCLNVSFSRKSLDSYINTTCHWLASIVRSCRKKHNIYSGKGGAAVLPVLAYVVCEDNVRLVIMRITAVAVTSPCEEDYSCWSQQHRRGSTPFTADLFLSQPISSL
jgi:hypothetical protein